MTNFNVLHAVWLMCVALNTCGGLQRSSACPEEQVQAATESTGTVSDTVRNSSFVDLNKQRFLSFDIVVNAPVDVVWNTIATEEGLRKWMAPIVKLDLRAGGSIQTNYVKTAKIGDEGTITLNILGYLPAQMLMLKVNLNDAFAVKCRREDKNLHEIILLRSLGENRTEITATMAGWGEGTEWDEAYSFFERGNKWTMEHLLETLQR